VHELVDLFQSMVRGNADPMAYIVFLGVMLLHFLFLRVAVRSILIAVFASFFEVIVSAVFTILFVYGYLAVFDLQCSGWECIGLAFILYIVSFILSNLIIVGFNVWLWRINKKRIREG
jgi:hypothetical protein